MLIQICDEIEYYDKIIDAVRFFMKTSRESKPFETIVSLICTKPISPSFQVSVFLLCNLPPPPGMEVPGSALFFSPFPLHIQLVFVSSSIPTNYNISYMQCYLFVFVLYYLIDNHLFVFMLDHLLDVF